MDRQQIEPVCNVINDTLINNGASGRVVGGTLVSGIFTCVFEARKPIPATAINRVVERAMSLGLLDVKTSGTCRCLIVSAS
jgi:hypothetical protein